MAKRLLHLSFAVVFFLFSNSPWLVLAADPLGNDWFQLHADPFTGGDDTGDGGTGNLSDLNYFYVGQTFSTVIEITSGGTTASNLWIDYDETLLQANNLTFGSFFDSWQGQSINNGRIASTAYNADGSQSSGSGDFGTVQFTMLQPSQANYGNSNPATLDINIGTVSQSTESNIAINGADILDDAEDFKFYVWADTKKPYVTNAVPANQSTDVLVDSMITFDLRDSLNGLGNDFGVGTGINTQSPAADITIDDGQGPISVVNLAVSTCSGIWDSTLCELSVDLAVITSFDGDTRKWDYGSAYTFEISGYADLASPSQNQLGDANGPNVMDSASFTFTTESDIVAPAAFNPLPVDGSADQLLDATISFDVFDRVSYPDGMSGSGVDLLSCSVEVTAGSLGTQSYNSLSSEFSFTAVDYGYHIDVAPAGSFSSGETVTVRLLDCADPGGNIMTEVAYSFTVEVVDLDSDGVLDDIDNCVSVANADQSDIDQDGLGDACDGDIDGDSILNEPDNCPLDVNPGQEDVDLDGIGDACDTTFDLDTDDDGLTDDIDNCFEVPNAEQEDLDEDGIGDACDTDIDGDTVINEEDNCSLDFNPDQADVDLDGAGDACDATYDLDTDGDTVTDNIDNCPLVSNTQQEDVDSDGIGNACDGDIDGDTILNDADNCTLISNPDQSDVDEDALGDVCDSDQDNDDLINEEDNCPLTVNPDQDDLDEDGIGDLCDSDLDGDFVNNELDNCPLVPNFDQLDSDDNGLGDVCDNEEERQRLLTEDSDRDGVPDGFDNCPFVPNEDLADLDGDGLGDVCDDDIDGDELLNDDDNCPLIVNPGQEDNYGSETVGDACEDTDLDTILDLIDNCPETANPGQLDADSDGEGDVCDFDDLLITVEELEEQLKPAEFEAKEEVEDLALEEAEQLIEETETIEVQEVILVAPVSAESVASEIDACKENPDYTGADFDDPIVDTDGDGVTDRTECYAKTNPLLVDTDGDGCGDGDELNQFGTDPNDPTDCSVSEEIGFDKVIITDPKPGWILGTLSPRFSGIVPVDTEAVALTAFHADQKMIKAFIRDVNTLLTAADDTTFITTMDALNETLVKANEFLDNNSLDFDYQAFLNVVLNLGAQIESLEQQFQNLGGEMFTGYVERLANLGIPEVLPELEALIKEPIKAGSTNVLSETFLGEQEARRFEFITDIVLDDAKLYDMVATATLSEESKSSVAIRFGVNTGFTINTPVPRTLGGKLIPGQISFNNLFIEGAYAQDSDGLIQLEIDDERPSITGDSEFGSQVFAIWNSIVLTSSVISDSEVGAFEIQAPRNLETDTGHRVTIYAVKTDGDNTLRSESVDVYFSITAPAIPFVPVAVAITILVVLGGALLFIHRSIQTKSTISILSKLK